MSAENIFRVTKEEREEVRKLCSQKDEGINEDIKHLKEWIRKQPHLPQDNDDDWLKMMLYYNKFSMEKTKRKVDMYHSIKNIVPEYFEDREPLNHKMEQFYKYTMVFPLPNLNNLVRIIFTKLLDNGSNFNMTNYIKASFGMFDLRMAHDCSVGESILIDFQSATLTHVTKITPVQAKLIYDILQTAYSDKIVYMDFINVSPIARTIVNVIISILPAKVKGKIRIHKNTEDLLNFYTPKSLPNEYGGTAGTTEELYDEWLKFLKSQNNWVKEVGLRRSDESKRIGEPLNSDMFGMCGSFKKLDVD